MKILIIGLGSMGQRRIRCLKALGYTDIVGYDLNSDLVIKVFHKYEITTCYELGSLMDYLDEYKFDAMFICVPPTMKQDYISLANRSGIPCFCEADIQSYHGYYYPSRTLIYHPAIRKIKELIRGKTLGTLYTFNYHLGQHIRDWHPGADYKNYYAAKEATGACKEMFCFEVAWLAWLLGAPLIATGMVSKQLEDEDVTADDVYATTVAFFRGNQSVAGTVLIDIVSRPAIRELRLVGEHGTLTWNWNNDFIHIVTDKKDVVENFEKGESAKGYNENIPEQMYVDEVKAFLHDAIGEKSEKTFFFEYEYSQDQEEQVIKMLMMVEK